VNPYTRASLLAGAAVAFLLVAPDFPSVRARMAAVFVSGPLVWLGTYSLERARTYLSDEWIQKDKERPVSRRYSWRPSDYGGAGKRWAISGFAALLLWFVLFTAVLLQSIR
jgi:hypothetical protein